VTKLKKQGMPVESVEAAVQWRRANIRFDMRAKQLPQTPPVASLQKVTELSLLALDALQCGEFELIAPKLREALRSLPPGADVCMPSEVWDALTRHVFKKVAASQDFEAGDLSDQEAETMGEFWLAIASGVQTPMPAV
jgi:hypothetical protein